MAAEEQKQEEAPVFSFKESNENTIENQLPASEVVEIKEEQQEVKTVETEEKKDPENEEVKTDEKKIEDTDPKEEEEENEVFDLNEELAFKYLKESKGLKYDSIDDFLKAGEAKKVDPEFEKYQEYKNKTGRGFGDFLATQKDWNKETPETIIKTVLRLDNPDLDSEDIDFLFDKKYGFDEDIDDDNDIRSRKINLKVDSRKALETLERQKEDYMVPRGSDDDSIPQVYIDAKDAVDQLYEEQIENEEKSKVLRNDFISKTNSVLNDKFEGFKFKADGQEFKIKPKDIKQTRESQSDISNFQKKFFDKESKMSDAEGYHKGLFVGMDPDEFFTIAFNLGKTTYAEKLEKESKNIDVKGDKHIPEPSLLEGFTFKKA